MVMKQFIPQSSFLRVSLLYLTLSLGTQARGNQIFDLIAGGTTCSSIIKSYVQRASQHADQLHIEMADALTTAENLDIYVEQNNGTFFGPLHCSPFLVGSYFDVAGTPTLPGHPALNESIPQIHAAAVKRLMDAGAVLIGKIKYTPLDSAVAVSTAIGLDLAKFGLVLDHNGSTLSAGAMAGVFSFRPTWTRISTEGTLPYSYFSDSIGIVAKSPIEIAKTLTVLDLAAKLSRLSGYIGADVLNVDGMSGLKIAAIKTMKQSKKNESILDNETEKILGSDIPDSNIAELYSYALDRFRAAGAELEMFEDAISNTSLYLMLLDKWDELTSCQPSWLDAYFGNKIRFPAGSSPFESAEDLEKSELITSNERETLSQRQAQRHFCPQLAEDYIEAQKDFTGKVLERSLKNFDVLVFPSYSEFPNSLKADTREELNPFEREVDLDTVIGSNPLGIIPPITGYPSITIPVGHGPPLEGNPSGLPAGVTLISEPKNMDKLITAAYAYQEMYGTEEVAVNLVEEFSRKHSSVANINKLNAIISTLVLFLWYVQS